MKQRMKPGELYHERKAEFLAAVAECESQTEIARRLKTSIKVVRRAAAKLGVKLPIGKRGRAPGDGEQPNSRRMISMIAARKRGASYEEIGQDWGLTRERVRQLLQRDRPDLCGTRTMLGLRKYKTHKFKCRQCSKTFQRRASAPLIYCSPKCSGIAKRRDLKSMRAVYIARRNGASFSNVGYCILGITDRKWAGVCAAQIIRRYAKYTGHDVSDAFGFDARQNRAYNPAFAHRNGQ